MLQPIKGAFEFLLEKGIRGKLFKPALAGQGSGRDASLSLSMYLFMYVSVSTAWGIWDLNFILTGTLIHLIYLYCYTAQNIVIKEGGKLTECYSNYVITLRII